MLAIRQEQMEVFRGEMLAQFDGEMIEQLRARFPTQTGQMSDASLQELIKLGRARARRYQVKAAKDVRRFIECMVAHGKNFDRDPATAWAGQILNRKNLTGGQKMNAISDYELFKLK